MSAGGAVVGSGGNGEPRHGVRIAILWAIFTVIVTPLVIWVAGPHVPPFDRSVQSEDQHTVNVVLLTVSVPVIATGGIADARGIVAAFALGASGVQLGTAYLRCPEAEISPLYRHALERVADNGTVLTNLLV